MKRHIYRYYNTGADENNYMILYLSIDNKVTTIVDASVDYQDSQLLEDFEDLIDVHTILEDAVTQIEVNREQLELLKFMKSHHEYDDDKEREVLNS